MACFCGSRNSFELALRKGDVQAALDHLEGDPIAAACQHFRHGDTLWHVVAHAGHTALLEALAARLAAVWPANANPTWTTARNHHNSNRNSSSSSNNLRRRNRNRDQHPAQLTAQNNGNRSSQGTVQRPEAATAPAAEGGGGGSGGRDSASTSPSRQGAATGADAGPLSASGPGASAAAAAGAGAGGTPNFQRRSNPFQRISDGLRGRGHDPSQLPLAAFVNAPNALSLTPLMTACQKGHAGCVQQLLALGANPWSRDRGNCTALHYAALRDHAACIQALLQHPSSARPPPGMRQTLVRLVDLPNFCGYTPAHFAAACARPTALAALLEGGANIAARCWAEGVDWISGPRGSTPLHFAARRGDTTMCKTILRHYLEVLRDTGAVDPRLHTDVRGWRPCQLASQRRQRELVEILTPQTPLTLIFADSDVMRLYKVPKLKALAAAAFQQGLLAQIDRAEEDIVQRRLRLVVGAAAGGAGGATDSTFAGGDAAAGGGAAAASVGSGGGGSGPPGGATPGEQGLSRASSLVATFSGALQSVGRQSLRSVRAITGRVRGPWMGGKTSLDVRKQQQQQGSAQFSPLLAEAAIAAAMEAAAASNGGASSVNGSSNGGTGNGDYSLATGTTLGAALGANGYGAVGPHNLSPRAGMPPPRPTPAAAATASASATGGGGGVLSPGGLPTASSSGHGLPPSPLSRASEFLAAGSETGVVPLKPGGEWPRTVSTSITNLAGSPSTGGGDGADADPGVGVGVVGVREQLPWLPGGVSPGLPGGVSPVRGRSFEGEPRPEPAGAPLPSWPALGAGAAAGTAVGRPTALLRPLPLPLPSLATPPPLASATSCGTPTTTTAGSPGAALAAPSPFSALTNGDAASALPPQHPQVAAAVPGPPPQGQSFLSPFAMPAVQSQQLVAPYSAVAPPRGGSPPPSWDGRANGSAAAAASGGTGGGDGLPSGWSPPHINRPSVPTATLGLQTVAEAGPAEELDGGGAAAAGAETPFGSPVTPPPLIAALNAVPGQGSAGLALADPGLAGCRSGALDTRSGPLGTTSAGQAPGVFLGRNTVGVPPVAGTSTYSGDGQFRPHGGATSTSNSGVRGTAGTSTPPRGSSPLRISSTSPPPPRGVLPGETVPFIPWSGSPPSAAEPAGGSPGSPVRPSARRSREYSFGGGGAVGGGGGGGGGGLLGGGVFGGIVRSLSRRPGASRPPSGIIAPAGGASASAAVAATDAAALLGSDTSEDVCGVCFERLAVVRIQPCMHALCAECCREVTRLVEARAPNCPFCRGLVRGFTAG